MSKTDISKFDDSLSSSPLLSEDIAVKDYTTEDFSANTQQQPSETGNAESPTQQGETKQESADSAGIDDFTPPDNLSEFVDEGDGTEPKPFTIDSGFGDDEDDGDSGFGGGDSGGFPGGGGGGSDVGSGSAKLFSGIAGKALNAFVPKMAGSFCKVDMSNIEYHIQQGGLQEHYRDAFRKVNETINDEMKFSKEEVDLFSKALQDFLEYNNIKATNPNSAFIGVVFMLAVSVFQKTMQKRSEVKDIIRDAMYVSDPNYEQRLREREFNMKQRDAENKQKDKDSDIE